MKNKETLYLIIFLLATFLLFGCNTKKKVIEKEQQSFLRVEENEWAKDSSIIEYHIDTTKLCEQTILVTKLEYYPIMEYDTTQGKYKQPIKSVTHKAITNKSTKKGETSVKGEELKTNVEIIKKDSTGLLTEKESTKTTAKTLDYWLWLAVIALIIAGIIYYIYQKKK